MKESVWQEADANAGNGQPQKKGFFDKVKGAAKKVGGAISGALKGLGKALDFIGTLTKNFSKDMLSKWRDAGYFTKDGQITGLGWKLMNKQAKNVVPVDTQDKSYDITQAANIVISNIKNAL
mgnify:CR=1 FL=1